MVTAVLLTMRFKTIYRRVEADCNGPVTPFFRNVAIKPLNHRHENTNKHSFGAPRPLLVADGTMKYDIRCTIVMLIRILLIHHAHLS